MGGSIKSHSTWLKKTLNPLLRKLFSIEICSIFEGEKIVGYGIRKRLK